jgi:hypothetical protein
MPTRIDNLFYELELKKKGFDQAVAKAQAEMRRMGVTSGVAATKLGEYDQAQKRAIVTGGGLRDAFGKVRNVALGVTAAITGMIVALGRFAQRGGEVTNIQRAFGRSAGEVEGSLNQLRQATHGLISDYDLMVGYNRAMTLGSAENIDQFGDLAQAAIALGRALGVDAAFALESLNLGIGRQSRLILDNLGLIVSVESANEQYAASLGKSTKELTENERRIAFRTAALESARRKIEQLGGVELNAADNVVRLTTALKNMRDALTKVVAKSPVVARFFEELAARAKTLAEAIAEILDPDRVLRDIERIEQATMEMARGRVRAEEVALRSLRDMRDRYAREAGIPEGLSEYDLRAAAEARMLAAYKKGRGAASREEYQAAERLLGILDEIEDSEERREGGLRRIAQLQRQSAQSGEEQREQSELSEELTKRRADLEKELADRISDVTLTAAERQLEAVRKLRDEYMEAFGEIGPEAEAQFAKLEEAAQQALDAERAERLADEFRDAIERGLGDIELRTLGIADPEERQRAIVQQQSELLERVLGQVEARLEAAELTVEEEEKLREVIREIELLLSKAADAQGDVAGEAKRDAQERLRNLADTLRLIRESVDGALDLAQAFGLVNDETRDTVEALTQMGAGIATLAKGIGAKDPASIIAGSLGILGGLAGLFAGGESPTQQAMRQRLEQNIRALEDLKASVDRLRGTLDLSGAEVTGARRALTQFFKPYGDIITGPVVEGLPRLREELARMGLTMGDLDRIAKELNVNIYDTQGRIDAINLSYLLDALREYESFGVGFADTLQGLMERLRIEFDLLDITDPVAQYQRIREELYALGKTAEGIPALSELLGIKDITSPEGRRRAEEAIRAIFAAFAAGRISYEQLGFASPEEFLEVLREMERLLDEVSEETAGQTEDVSRQVQITELQAGQLLAFQATQTLLQEQMRDRLTGILDVLGGNVTPIQPPIPPIYPELPAPGVTNIDVGPLEVVVYVNGGTKDVGESVAEDVYLAVKRRFGQEFADRERLLGIRR